MPNLPADIRMARGAGRYVSIRVVNWVLEHSEARREERLVLVIIADEADDLGLNSHPSQRRIAEKSRVPQSTVRECIRRLEGAGELLVKRPPKPAPGRVSRYVVVMGRDPHELAQRLRWPEPLIVAEVVEEWEQLTLDTKQMRAQHAADGYEMAPQSMPVAPYPVVEEVGDGPPQVVDKAENLLANRVQPSGTERPIARADPPSLFQDQASRGQPTSAPVQSVEETKAMLEQGNRDPGEEYPPIDKVREYVAKAKGELARDETLEEAAPEEART